MHGGDLAAIKAGCMDIGPAFIMGVTESLCNATITFGKFHGVKIVNDAVDPVRRTERSR